MHPGVRVLGFQLRYWAASPVTTWHHGAVEVEGCSLRMWIWEKCGEPMMHLTYERECERV